MNTLGEAKCDGLSQDQEKAACPAGAWPMPTRTRATTASSSSMKISTASRVTCSRAETWMPR